MAHYYDNEPLVASKEHEICFELNSVKFSLITDNGVFSKKRVDETFELIKSIQSNLGYPVEIELAYTELITSIIAVTYSREVLSQSTSVLYPKITP